MSDQMLKQANVGLLLGVQYPEGVLLDELIDLVILLSNLKNNLYKLTIKLVLGSNKISIQDALLQLNLTMRIRLGRRKEQGGVSHHQQYIYKYAEHISPHIRPPFSTPIDP
jgi:hypothetical protein